jgi:hypothetical protein
MPDSMTTQPKGNTLSDFDPFDNVPADETTEEAGVFDAPPADAPKKAPAKKVAVKAPSVGTDEGKIVLTFKEGAGFDASWTVIHANNVSEAKAILSDPEFKELLDQSKKVATYFRGGSTPAAPARAAGGGNGRPGGATQPPDWFPPAPGEGWEYKSAMKKDGSGMYHAWAPPRGSDAKWQFINPPK